MDDALWRGASARDFRWSGAPDHEAASAAPSRRGFLWLGPLAAALSSFLFVAFVGGGLYVGALALYQLSVRQAETGAVVPKPLTAAVGIVTGGGARRTTRPVPARAGS